jgi:hypothetical protein
MNAEDVENLTIAGLAPEIKDRKVSPVEVILGLGVRHNTLYN